jgi:hypothetical protein
MKALQDNVTGDVNTAVGTQALWQNISGYGNVAVGNDALAANTKGNYNVAIGFDCMATAISGYTSVGVGTNALYVNAGGFNVAVGAYALEDNDSGEYNVAVGCQALNSNTAARYNTAIGTEALKHNTIAEYNTAVGNAALISDTTGDCNTAVGHASMSSNTIGYQNTAAGYGSLYICTSGYQNTAVGYEALGNVISWHNCAGLGYGTEVSGDNEVQLGNSATTVYVYGTVQTRPSDGRDKADIRDTILGLDFINKIRPVDYRIDLREDYYTIEDKKVEYEEKENYKDSDGSIKTRMVTKNRIEKVKVRYEKDGSKKRTRFHHGVIAQEVKESIDELGIDFAGYQDHAIKGGEDVLTIGYNEFIAPLIKAVQELSAKNDELLERIKVLESK